MRERPVGQVPSGKREDRHQHAIAESRPLELQQLAGNRAVAGIIDQIARQTLQRVAVKERPPNETLYNQPGAGGKAGAAQYGGAVSYDMTRNGDRGVTVTIRIQFLNQARNGVDPASPGAAPGTPRLGALIGSPTEIPATDPDNRRQLGQWDST